MANTKRMIHDAYGLYHLRREGSGGDPVSGRIHGMAKAVWAGKIMAAVENQKAPLPDLLLLCYAPDAVPTVENLERLRVALVGHILAREEIKQHRTIVKLRALAEVAVISFRHEMRGFGPLRPAGICLMAGIDIGNWTRGDRPWPRWWHEMGRQMARWHRQAMGQPDRICGEIEKQGAAADSC